MNMKYLFPGRESKFTLKTKNSCILTSWIKSVPNGIILPLLSNDYQAPGTCNSGGVCDSSGNFLNESLYRGEYMKRGGGGGGKLGTPTEIVHEKVIFSGYFIKHWGHFLVDSIGRFWPLCDKKFDGYKVVFLTDKFSTIEGSYLEFLSYLGVSKDKLLDIEVPTQFDEVLIPSISYDASGNFSPEHRKMIDFIAKNACIEDITVPSKVYLTRRKFTFARRKEVGEKDIERVFADNDYTVISPEKLPLKEQIALFRKSDEIVCVNGTIPLNVFFARSDLKLTILNKTSLAHSTILKACNFAGVEPVYIDVYYEPFRHPPKTLGYGPFWMIITDNLIRFLSDNHMKADTNMQYGIMKRAIDWSNYLRCYAIAFFRNPVWKLLRYLRKTHVWKLLRYIKKRIKL